ncbi:MAG: membrane integrity-associated transporter subunit PqiC [Sulfurovum sp.]|nr:membrane integrity-associated transporter subunit PqiC [Sulfurovaceae bacterium]
MRYLILIIFLYGCSSKLTPILTYSLNPKIDIKEYKRSIYKNSTIKVAYPTSIDGLIGKRMKYSYSESEQGLYNNARWSSPSGRLLINIFIKALNKSQKFESVLGYTSLVNTDYLLESEIYEFSHKIRGEKSLAVVSMKFNFINMSNNMLIKSKKFQYQIPTDSFDAEGYTKATKKALIKISLDMLDWL